MAAILECGVIQIGATYDDTRVINMIGPFFYFIFTRARVLSCIHIYSYAGYSYPPNKFVGYCSISIIH